MKAMRWGDNDRYWGPFTWSRSQYINWGIELASRGEESPCHLLIRVWKWALVVVLPAFVLKPEMEKVYPDWDRETKARLQRDWYWKITKREYGFNFSGTGDVANSTALHLHYGRQTWDSSTEQSKCYFLPWTQYRHVRHSYYGLEGNHFADAPEVDYRLNGTGIGSWEYARVLEASVPVSRYRFKDFDGEELVATVRLEEREWRRGEGWFKWMSWFWPPIIHRSAYLDFSGETGKRKGSWKGGTMACGIELEHPFDLHLDGFLRYCRENNMTFIGFVHDELSDNPQR